MTAAPRAYDIVFAGGGLASGLIAHRLVEARPDLSIAIVEAGERLGANHTWSFHEYDVTPSQAAWLEPFIVYRWAGQTVHFPDRDRALGNGYRTVTSERFHEVISGHARGNHHIDLLLGERAKNVTPDEVELASGEKIQGRLVFDGRGPVATAAMTLGFQKFLGLEVEFEEPHGLTDPIIMDATVPQTDGYRFVYVLPFTPTTALIEDTYYADGFDLPQETLRQEILSYADKRGWTIKRTMREEQGILPIVLDGDIDRYWSHLQAGPIPVGLRAGLFHQLTGYSLGEAARLADMLAAHPLDNRQAVFRAVESHSKKRWYSSQFYRLLNRMLFRAAAPEKRYIVLQRFFGLPEGLIKRFYAGDTPWRDQLRVLAGKPPVPIGAALKALPARQRGTMIEEGLLG